MKLLKRPIAVLIALVMTVLVMPLSLACGAEPGSIETPPEGDVEYTVTVLRSGGYAISGVTVLAESASEESKLGSTDKDGKYSFTAKAGTFSVRVANLPVGYKAQKSYTVDWKNPKLEIRLSASLLPVATEEDKPLEYGLGSVMHDFAFTDTQGNESSLAKLLETKKAVLLNFWFINCGYCVLEFPDMKESYLEYNDKIEIVGLNFTDTAAESEDFRVNKDGSFDWDELPFMMVGREGGVSGEMATAFGVTGCPTSVIIDREGVVCFIGTGAADKEEFDSLFAQYTAEPYVQKIYYPGEAIVDKPDVAAPTSQQIEAAINNTASGFEASYKHDPDEYNWPWVVDGDAIKTSNGGHNNSYAILSTTFELTAGGAVAFDCKYDTEARADEFFVMIDGIPQYTFSGDSEGYKTCYAYVAPEAGEHTLSLIYLKDSSKSKGEDAVYVKNMRFLPADDIAERTELVYLCAVGDKAPYKYSTVVYNEEDNYYHVGAADGPLVLADLMNGTKLSSRSAWSYAQNGVLSYDLDGDGKEEDYYKDFVKFAQYSNNSRINGLIAVTKELKTCLDALTHKYFKGDEDTWLELCSYYRVFGGEEGEQIIDPTTGVSPYTAYDTVVNETEAEHGTKLNTVDKFTVIMPRGIWFKFVPSATAVYRVYSVGKVDTYVWIADAEGTFIAENNDDENSSTLPADEVGNFSVVLAFEAGKTYYILCDFNSVETMGKFDFAIDKLASSGVVWTPTAAAHYYGEFDEDGNLIGQYVADAVDFTLNGGSYYVRNKDGSIGSQIYINLCGTTGMFTSNSIEQMANMTCHYCLSCGTKYSQSESAFDKAADPVCYLCGNHGKSNFQKRKMFELPTPQRDGSGRVIKGYVEHDDGTVYGYPKYELDTDAILDPNNYMQDIKTYGIKFEDYTDIILDLVDMSKTYYPTFEEIYDTGRHVGFYPATASLVDILKKFIVFGDYALEVTLDNAWLMLGCYYLQI